MLCAHHATVLAVLCAAACGSHPASPGPDAPAGTAGLGMNDVTMLLPLPADLSAPTVLAMTGTAGAELVPRDLFARLVTDHGDVPDHPFEQFQLVAIRVDLCDRTDPGPCPAGSDGRLRLVFQPVDASAGDIFAYDVALHAFYPIPAGELATVIDELRSLAQLAGTPPTNALAVSTAVADPAYTTQLRALVAHYAIASQLDRLTLFAELDPEGDNWTFRGVELAGAAFTDIAIPGIDAIEQKVSRTFVGPTYQVIPFSDVPVGLGLAFDRDMFMSAAAPGRMQALEALEAALNPMLSSPHTEQCVGCHAATIVAVDRGVIAGIDPSSVAGHFTASTDLSITTGIAATEERSLRALGWFSMQPAISQRVANDTAEVLVEIAQRFPAH